MSQPIADIIANLSQPIHPAHLKSKTRKSKTGAVNNITFISWYSATIYLDRYAPGWSYEIRTLTSIGELCAVVARISIPCAEGVVYREGTGCEDDDHEGFGDPTSNAEAMALKRAAAKFGLGRYLYDKDRIHKIPAPTKNDEPEWGTPTPINRNEAAMKAQAPLSQDKLSKEDLSRIYDLKSKLEELGFTEPQFHAQLKQITGKESPNELDPAQAGKAKASLSAKINELLSKQRKSA